MALFGCVFDTPGYTSCPEPFKTCVARGNRFKAAAFRCTSGSTTGEVFVALKFDVGITDAGARLKFQKQLAEGGTIGHKFPLSKLVLMSITRIQGVLAPAYTTSEILVDMSGLLQPLSQLALAPTAAAISRDAYAILGLARGATDGQLKSAFHTAILAHHPDKGGDSGKFHDVIEAYTAIRGTGVSEAPVVYPSPPKPCRTRLTSRPTRPWCPPHERELTSSRSSKWLSWSSWWLPSNT